MTNDMAGAVGHPMGAKQTIIHEVWSRLEGPFGLRCNVSREIVEKGVEIALHVLRRQGITLSASPQRNEWRELIISFVKQEIDYMRLNHLGDPEKQHNIRWARALGITEEETRTHE